MNLVFIVMSEYIHSKTVYYYAVYSIMTYTGLIIVLKIVSNFLNLHDLILHYNLYLIHECFNKGVLYI